MEEFRAPDDTWLREPGRSEVFQKWMNSLESREVRRLKAQVEGKTNFNAMNRPKT